MTMIGAIRFLKEQMIPRNRRLSLKFSGEWYDGDAYTALSGEALILLDYIWESV